MDFSTIKNQMEAKDGTGYKNVRDTCAEVRLVFDNAMKYNGDGSDVHLMAKTLLEKLEKWQLLLTNVTEEVTLLWILWLEKRREEEAEAQSNMHSLYKRLLMPKCFMRLIHISNSSEIPSSENAGKCQQKIKEIWGLP
ncbi:hypothetical protein V6N11_054002 [Hibiscus sabdariffa]|uniref:Bromo domain-containing protein n=1 Tax=Hibiscus sabdariffa TaxID=183260 RepID=A0ABR2S2S1_9ROSI